MLPRHSTIHLFCSPEFVMVKKTAQNWRIFSNRWFCKYFIPVPYAKIRFPLLLATGSLHLLSSFATLLWGCPKCTNMEDLWGCVNFRKCFYHPSWRAGTLPGDVVTDASILAGAPLLALWAMLPGGTEVLAAEEVVVDNRDNRYFGTHSSLQPPLYF